MLNKIQVIDAPCGSGKTEYIIRYMNAHPEELFLYIAPLRKMFDRIAGVGEYVGRGAKEIFKTPTHDNPERTLRGGIKQLIRAGENIMSTHQLFMMFDNETISLLQERNYHLIIDEALNSVSVIKTKVGKTEEEDEVFKGLEQSVKVDDLRLLLDGGYVTIDYDQKGLVRWIGSSIAKDHRFADLEAMVKSDAIYALEDDFLVWHFPVKAIEAFGKVTVLTYRFDSSEMRAYLQFNRKPYETKTVRWKENEPYLADLTPEVALGLQWAQYIHILENDRLNAVGERLKKKGKFPLSFSWYQDKSSRAAQKTLRDNVTNYFRHRLKANPDSVMWTTYKKYEDKVYPKGYTRTRSDRSRTTFVACNCRATEEYKDRYNLAYFVDRNLNPGLIRFFAQEGIYINRDEWALSEMIQWIFRSRIRDGGAEDRSINIYIPSARMRRLLEEWLGESEVASAVAVKNAA